MIGSARTLLVWSSFLAVLAIVLWAVFDGTWIEAVLLGAAALAVATTAAAMLLRRAVSPGSDPDLERPLPELSAATTCVAAALSAIVLGLQFGVWLVMIGCGLLALGVGGLIRERRAEPPARRGAPRTTPPERP